MAALSSSPGHVRSWKRVVHHKARFQLLGHWDNLIRIPKWLPKIPTALIMWPCTIPIRCFDLESRRLLREESSVGVWFGDGCRGLGSDGMGMPCLCNCLEDLTIMFFMFLLLVFLHVFVILRLIWASCLGVWYLRFVNCDSRWVDMGGNTEIWMGLFHYLSFLYGYQNETNTTTN